MTEKAWLDITVIRCPVCGRYYVDASWYVTELGADIECGKCGTEFPSRKYATDRIMLEFEIDKEGKAQKAEITERLR